MVEETEETLNNELPLDGVGSRLRRERKSKGLSLEQVAEETKIAERHLHLIENDQFSDLPARTYAFGFTRTYARMLGMDENELIADLRAELDHADDERPRYTPAFEPGDPAKAPPAGVVWASAVAVLLLAVGSYAFYARVIAPGANPAPLVAVEEPQAEIASSGGEAELIDTSLSGDAPANEVVFTALEEGIWVSFYEAGGQRLEQKLMALGESFVVPEEARDPRVWTGRPDAFEITVGGQAVPKLADEQVTLRDIPITAEALRARPSTEPASSEVDASTSQQVTG